MQWIWSAAGQRPCLEDWEGRPLAAGVASGPRADDVRGRFERVVAHEAPGPPAPDGPHRRVAHALLSFQVFPPHLVTGVHRRPEVEAGDVVGICFHGVPGLDLFFAARVLDRFDGPDAGLWRTGFRYATLQGHPLCGEETFCVEKDLRTGEVTAALRSWSRPGTLLARALRPLLRSLQRYAGRAALAHLARVAANG